MTVFVSKIVVTTLADERVVIHTGRWLHQDERLEC